MVQKLETIGAMDLCQETFPPIEWSVENLVGGSGCYILASLPKQGKGFFVLGMGLAITEGKPFLTSFPTHRSGVCILGIEDRLRRLQSRLWLICPEIPSNDLRLAERSERLDSGLVEQLEFDLRDHPQTGVYVIDTYASVRTPGAEFGYQSDYDDLSLITNWAESHSVCVVVCHHLNKSVCPSNPFLCVSGTTGLVGAVTGVLVLHDDAKCAEGECIMSVEGKDVERSHYRVALQNGVWDLVEPLSETQLAGRAAPDCVNDVVAFMHESMTPWQGRASELVRAANIGDADIRPDVFGRYLAQHRDYMARCGVAYEMKHTRGGNVLTIEPIVQNS